MRCRGPRRPAGARHRHEGRSPGLRASRSYLQMVPVSDGELFLSRPRVVRKNFPRPIFRPFFCPHYLHRSRQVFRKLEMVIHGSTNSLFTDHRITPGIGRLYVIGKPVEARPLHSRVMSGRESRATGVDGASHRGDPTPQPRPGQAAVIAAAQRRARTSSSGQSRKTAMVPLIAAAAPARLALAQEGPHPFAGLRELAGGGHHLDRVGIGLGLVQVDLSVESLLADALAVC
jgi:hypothetical protein